MPEAPGAEGVEEDIEALRAGAASKARPDEPTAQPIFTGSHGVGARFAGRIGRHATAYGAASVSTLIAGLVGIAVFTRFLDPSQFGKMAVLSTLATIITMLATLGIMQGTMRRVFGSTGDDDAGELDAGEQKAVASDPRLALATGLALTFAFGAVLFVVAALLSGKVAELFGGPDDRSLILLAAGAGVAGGVMRFSRNILRLQLRSAAYLVVTVVYSFAGIPVAIPLLAGGWEIEAVLIGFIVANVLAAAISLALLLSDLRPAVSLREAGLILRGGLAYLPILLSFQAVQLGDTLLVAIFGGFSDAGVYRVAQRISMPVSYGTSVFQQSWGPMRRDLTQAAVDRVDEGRESRVYTARLFTYYAVFVTALILGVAVFSEQLVKFASGQFGEAAALVPITALSVAGHGWFVFAYRNSRLPRQMVWMVSLALLSAIGFVALSVLLVPAMGAIGAPLAAVASWSLATFVMLLANQLIGEAIPYEYRNLLALVGLSLLVGLIAGSLLPDTLVGTIAKLALLTGWAASLVAVGVVPMAEVRAVGRLARDASGIDSKHRLRARLADLDGVDATLVEELVYRRRSPRQAAERAGLSEEEAMTGAVHALRRAAGGGKPQETDAELGALLFTPMPRTQRDMGVMAMVSRGADPIDADLVKRALAAARPERKRSRRAFGSSRLPLGALLRWARPGR